MIHFRLTMASCLSAAAFTSTAAAQHCEPGWGLLPTGPDHLPRQMTTFDEGSGPAFFVAGSFTSAGGVPTGPIARWDGTNWSAVGSVVFNLGISRMTVLEDAFGKSLYVASRFLPSGGFDAKGLARWDGTQWHPASAGLELLENGVGSVVVHDAGDGPHMYAGGSFWFTAHGFNGPRYFARWNGQVWEPVGGGTPGHLQTLISFDDGAGPMLYAYGHVLSGPGGLIITLGRWDGAEWHDLRGTWRSGIGDLIKYEDGAGERLVFYGGLRDHHGQDTRGAFVWSANDWVPIGITNIGPLTTTVWDDGSGPALYIAGSFTTVNGAPMPRVAAWDGNSWRATGAESFAGTIYTLGGFIDERGPVLYAGGHFPNSAGPHLSIADYRTCYDIEPCYANCDKSTGLPLLNLDDFTCFINEFATGMTLPPSQQLTHYANCDRSTTPPVLNIDDFTCFINAFAMGCP